MWISNNIIEYDCLRMDFLDLFGGIIKMKKSLGNALLMSGLLLGLAISSSHSLAKEITIDAKPVTTETATTETATTENKGTTDAKTEKTATDGTNSIKATPSQETSEEASEDASEEDGEWNSNKTSYIVDGEKVKGWYKIKGKRYYFNKNGKLYTKTGMQTIGEKTYYFDDDHYVLSGVIDEDDKVYYFRNKDGLRVEDKGINSVDGKVFLVGEDAVLTKGWYRDENGKRYYFDKKTYEGYTGWHYVGKYKYYFNKKAQLVQDVRKKLTKKQKKSYFIRVNRTASCVTVYAKDGLKGYTIPVVAFVCSAGKDTPTGTFTTKDKLRWHELMGPCWGQWCMHLTTDILFHSVYYDRERDNKSLNVGAYNKLGTMASHGCVRMTAGDCKWLYDNCKVGTKVEIYNNKKNPGPFDKPEAAKLSSGHTWDPTDPAFKK